MSGPSGSGKTTLCRFLSKKYDLHYGISHTTRPKRESERNGVDYYFVTHDEFNQMIGRQEFLEHATVYDNLYGTSMKSVYDYLDHGQGVILDVDTQGAKSISARCPEAFTIFIKGPSLEELKARLTRRGTDDEAVIAKRLMKAQEEEARTHYYDKVVTNDDLNRARVLLSQLIEEKYAIKSKLRTP